MITREEVCCEQMWTEMESVRKKELNEDGAIAACIWYNERLRKYLLLFSKQPDDFFHFYGYPIEYCPFCGKKLPKSLYPEGTLYKEYGEDYLDLYCDKDKRLPPEIRREFDTDEWWKKRGL